MFPVRFDMLDEFAVSQDAAVPIDTLLDLVQRCFHGEIRDEEPILPIAPPHDDTYEAWMDKVHHTNSTFARFTTILYNYRPVCPFDTMSHPAARTLRQMVFVRSIL